MKILLKSFEYAWHGIRYAMEGRNFLIELVIAVVVIILSLLLDISRGDFVAVIILCGIVLAFEAMNTAIEVLVNLVSPEFHPLAGRVKDLAAGAVLIVSITSVVAGVVIFLPYILPL